MQKSRKLLLPLIIVLLLLAAAVCLLVLGNRSKITPYLLLGQVSNADELSADISVDTTIGSNTASVQAALARKPLEKDSVTRLEIYGTSLYYSNDLIVMENGSAYKLGISYLDYTALLKTLLPICKDAKYQKTKEGDSAVLYSISIDGDQASEVLALAFPDLEEEPAEIGSVIIEIEAEDNTAKSLSLKAEGILSGSDAASFQCDFALQDITYTADFDIPESVNAALLTGVTDDMPELSEDLLCLASAVSKLMTRDSFSSSVQLAAECSFIDLNQKADFSARTVDGRRIYSLSTDNLDIYFNENGIVTADGTRLTGDSSETTMTNIPEVLNTALEICLKGNFTKDEQDDTTTYTMTLDSASMQELFLEALPQAESLDITYKTGVLTAKVTDGTLTGLSLECGGTVKILIINSNVSLRIDFFLNEETPDALPDAAVEALK